MKIMKGYTELKNKFENDASNLITNTLQSFDKILKELNEKDNLILLKDRDIQMLKNELEKKDEECIVLKNNIEQLEQEFRKIKNTAINEIIIIPSPKDIFNYSNDIVDKYVKSINWDTMSFDNIVELISFAVESINCKIVDEALGKIADYRLKGFNREELNTIVMLMGKYIKKQLSFTKYSILGIYKFLKKVNKLNYTELIKNFMNNIYPKLELLVTKTTKSTLNDLHILEILKTYFILSLDSFANKLLDNICDKEFFTKETLPKEDCLSLLFIAVCFEKDMMIFDKLNGFDKLMECSLSEVRCYKLYNRGLEEEKFRCSFIEEIRDFQQKFSNNDVFIKNKTVSFMKHKLQNLIEEDKKKIEKNKKQDVQPIISNTKMQFRKIEEVGLIKNKLENCPMHSENISLKKGMFHLKYYANKKSKKKNISAGYIDIELLYCEKCSRVFINQDILDQTNPQISLQNINRAPLFNNSTIKNISKTTGSNAKTNSVVKLVDKKGVSYYPTFGGKSNNQCVNKHAKKYENNLREESELKKLGYSTSLSREARWDILKNKAIKTLGIKKIMNHISFLISLNRNKKNGDYSRALQEWKYDFERLRKLL